MKLSEVVNRNDYENLLLCETGERVYILRTKNCSPLFLSIELNFFYFLRVDFEDGEDGDDLEEDGDLL
jgi:hypothetical protein